MKVLFVDDDPDDSEIFSEILKDIDATIQTFTCSKQSQLTEFLTDFCPDYIFIDYRMPIVDGKETLTRLREHPCFAAMKIVMYSTSMSDWDQQACKRLGAYHCVQKVGDLSVMREQLSSIVKGETHYQRS